MNQRNLFWISIFSISLSCGGGNDSSQNEVHIEQDTKEMTTIDSRQATISENLVTEIKNSSEALNESLNIIDTLFLPIHGSVQDGFALMNKFETEIKTELKTYVFDRNSKGELIQKNSFSGVLLGKDTLVTDYPRIMLRFVERFGNNSDLYSYNCWFGFDFDCDKYVFEHCISINKTYDRRRNSLDVYVSDIESIEDQLIINNEVLSVLEKNNYLN
ncbi:hypothetical protein N9E11_03870 [Crocinitomicaceae bacterium]|nr:hypothetical protein [Crocinitomicaceae bacterium]MDB4606383.1 hypothetical protein [Crocinitomicaceae bacterium]